MTTLIEVHNDELGTTRRCDATCHEAKGDECGCICGGKLHGLMRNGSEIYISGSFVAEVREQVVLEHGDSLQLRLDEDRVFGQT